MKVKIEIEPNMEDYEVTIRCAEIDEGVAKIRKLLAESFTAGCQINFVKGDKEFFLPMTDILFFETDGGLIWAHTPTEAFEVKNKLYELESMLPGYFMRISKSAILNVKKVYSITRNLTGASKIEFQGTPKIVFCSRNYYKVLKDKLTV
ncbi:MAG: LytTR family transcriptional regulator [Lachnospiraceae bacterium]|nr:LytTR family transcriptional regulator [Lachnospiraceae bacterium]